MNLETIITRALDGGWDMFGHAEKSRFSWEVSKCLDSNSKKLTVRFEGRDYTFVEVYQIEQIIFNVPFAKALFGEGNAYHYHPENCDCYDTEIFPCSTCEDGIRGNQLRKQEQPLWIYHIQQYAPMETNDQRIEYIRKETE